jgi:hypothetical protein
MSNQSDFYVARAEHERSAADRAELVNVRENHLRAAAAWDVLAARALKADRMRTAEEARKAEVKAGLTPA